YPWNPAPTPSASCSHAISAPRRSTGPPQTLSPSSAAGFVNTVVHVAPPSTVRLTSPLAETHPTLASSKHTDCAGENAALQLSPPSFVRYSVPAWSSTS